MNPCGFRRQVTRRGGALLRPRPALAQQWSVYCGAAGRVEYNDNYFFTAPGPGRPGPLPATARSPPSRSRLIPSLPRRGEPRSPRSRRCCRFGVQQGVGHLAHRGLLERQLRAQRHAARGTRDVGGQGVLLALASAAECVARRRRRGAAPNLYRCGALLAGSYDVRDLRTAGRSEASVGGFANRYDYRRGHRQPIDDCGYNVGGKLGYRLLGPDARRLHARATPTTRAT